MLNRRLITLTLNPALDVSTSVPDVVPEHKLRCASGVQSAGGGGINVSRALKRLGYVALAVFASGGPTGRRLEALLTAEAVPCLPVSVADETRQNLAVRETGSGAQFRFVLPGPTVTTVELENCISAALSRVEKGDYLIASGSLPLGVANDAYRILAARAEEAGAYFVLDCPASSLRASLGAGVSLIKPSFSEFTQLTGVSPADRSAALRAIDDLVAHEKTKAVALSLGRQGAWFVSRDIAIAATAPKVDVVSTVGAGDSFLAALVAKLAGGGTPAEALRLAVASGTAALLRPGAELCRQEDVNALSAAVAVEPLR